MKTLLGLIQTTRIVTSLIVGFSVFGPSLSMGLNWLESALVTLPFILSAIGGFALNDYFDISRDKINHPNRAIPSGKITPTTDFVFSIIVLVGAVFASFYVSNTLLELSIYLITTLGVVFYNFIVKKYSLLKSYFTSALVCIPLFFDVTIYKYEKILFLIPTATFLFILGREFLMDVRDLDGDKLSGIITTPMVIGIERTSQLGFIFQFFCIVFLLPIIFYNPLLLNILLFILINLTAIVSFIFWRVDKKGRFRRRIISLMKVPMIAGIVMLILN